MPVKRQIQFLHEHIGTDGATHWHWKPSPRLRKAGFVNVTLGSDKGAAFTRAIELNRQVAEWDAARKGDGSAPGDRAPGRPALPRIVRFDELVRRYQASDEYRILKPATKRDYSSRMRQLTAWADDGTLPVASIDHDLIKDLRKVLLQGSTHRAGAVLRVARLLFQWAVDERIVTTNPVAGVSVPGTPPRNVVIGEAAMLAIDAAARSLTCGTPEIALARQIGFWLVQREADIIALNRFAWGELSDVDPRDAAVLANPRGRVMGFTIVQEKTGAQVALPAPPFLHAAIEAAFAKGAWLLPRDGDPLQPIHEKTFQRRFAAARSTALEAAREHALPDERLIADLERCQFRDLRRTGMVFYRTVGVPVPQITALSGHAVLGGKKTILDTYMPRDTRSACACVAHGLRHLAARAEREKAE